MTVAQAFKRSERGARQAAQRQRESEHHADGGKEQRAAQAQLAGGVGFHCAPASWRSAM